VLYQFGAKQIDRQELLCRYPLILKSSAGGAASAAQTVTVKTDDGKTVTVTIGSTGGQGGEAKETFVVPCGQHGSLVSVQPDPAFLVQPSCVICRGPTVTFSKKEAVELAVNERLTNYWLEYSTSPLGPGDAYSVLGLYDQKILYVTSPRAYAAFNEFALFILEATIQSAPSAAGQSAGKGTPSKTPAIFMAPAGTIQRQ